MFTSSPRREITRVSKTFYASWNYSRRRKFPNSGTKMQRNFCVPKGPFCTIKCSHSWSPYSSHGLIEMFVSFLSHFWLIHFFHLRLLYQPYLGLCQAPCVQSHQRQPMSAVAINGCWFSDRSNCSHWSFEAAVLPINPNIHTDQYTTLLLLLLLVLIQLCSPRCWHLDSNYCRTRCRKSQSRFVLSPLLLHPRLLETFQSDIPLFTLTWPAEHSPNQGWESTHRLHLYPLGGVFYSP